MNSVDEELRSIALRWDEAMLTNDVELIGNFLSEDWVIAGADGITSREDFLQFIESGVLTHTRMDSDEMIIKSYGDTAVVLSKGTSAGMYAGQPFSLYEWSASTFIIMKGRWLCVATMLTAVK